MTKTKAQKQRAKQAKANVPGPASQKTKKRRARNPLRGKGDAMQPAQLQLHSAQNDSAVSTWFRFKPGTVPHSAIIEGRDLARVAVSATSAVGAYVGQARPVSVITGSSLVTRWEQYAALFSKWRIVKLSSTLVSGQATSVSGFNYQVFDPTETATGDPATAEALMRFEGSTMGVAYANLRCEFPTATQLKWYDTQAAVEVPTSTPGDLHFGSDGYGAAVVPGKLLIDYEIEFADPR